jgi:hypothetical protein
MHGAFPLSLVGALSNPSPEQRTVATSFPCRARGTTRRARHRCPKGKACRRPPIAEGAEPLTGTL